jgi:NhaA family Na+:H+ antiporter
MRHQAAAHLPIAVAEARRPAAARVLRYATDRFLLLPIGAGVALVWANTAAESYFRFAHGLAFLVNEVGMAFFLALIAQEVVEAMMPGGSLHTWRRWALPVVAAGGGIGGAAAVYLAYVMLKHEAVLLPAWPIACAVDVAAAYYVLAIVWRRGSALPFVLLLALATDAVGVAIVALRADRMPTQPGGILLVVAAIALAALLRRAGLRSFWGYVAICGVPSWYGLYWEGLHPALALLPIVPFLPRKPRTDSPFLDPGDDGEVHHFEHQWNEVVQVILFLFGLVNAGVLLRGYGTGTWAILAAGLAGRPLGILAAVWLATMAGFRLPGGVGWRGMTVIAVATSSGFTFALFFATGLIPMGPVLAEIKLGALATVAAALVALGLARTLRVGRLAHSTAVR